MVDSVINNVTKDIMNKYGQADKKRKPQADLSKDSFLNLLTTQLRYQNPLEPTNDKEFLAQMAQFTALEQMQNLNTSVQNTRAASLIGKDIYAEIIEENGSVSQVRGIVEYINIKDGKQFLVVDGKEVEMSQVSQVGLGVSSDIMKDLIIKNLEELNDKMKLLNDTTNENLDFEKLMTKIEELNKQTKLMAEGLAKVLNEGVTIRKP